MEDSTCCDTVSEQRLFTCFSYNSGGFDARNTLPLKDPEPPRGSPSLSPKPVPKSPSAGGDRSAR